jgi:hypothetical protein
VSFNRRRRGRLEKTKRESQIEKFDTLKLGNQSTNRSGDENREISDRIMAPKITEYGTQESNRADTPPGRRKHSKNDSLHTEDSA